MVLAGISGGSIDLKARTDAAINRLVHVIDLGLSLQTYGDSLTDDFDDKTGVAVMLNAAYDAAGRVRLGAGPSADITSPARAIHYGMINPERAFNDRIVTEPTANTSLRSSHVPSAGLWIGQDFGAPKTIIKMRWYRADVASPTAVTPRYSDDGVTWVNLPRWGLGTRTSTWFERDIDAGAHRYWALRIDTGRQNNRYEPQSPVAAEEIEMLEALSGAGAVESVTVEADNVPAQGRIVALIEDMGDGVDLSTLNLELSRDGGAAWAGGVLEDHGEYASGIRIVSSGVISLGGAEKSNVRARMTTDGTKGAALQAWTVQWR